MLHPTPMGSRPSLSSYDQIGKVAGTSFHLRECLLAHVLAHEIGHVLEVSDAHSSTGVMKAYWDWRDYFAMNQGPLEFASVDVHRIRQGLSYLKSRSGRQDASASSQ
jgi:hypothetical protein